VAISSRPSLSGEKTFGVISMVALILCNNLYWEFLYVGVPKPAVDAAECQLVAS
jgi:hypothetical protein